MADYDLLVLGAGNAGIAAANAALKAGWSVAVVEKRDVGGTCPLRGCVPKKVLVAAAQTFDVISRADRQQVSVKDPSLEWAKLIEHKHGFIEGVSDEMKSSIEKRGAKVLAGKGRFVGPTTIELDGKRIEARKIVIATGSKPRSLPFPGAKHLLTSDDLLELRNQPTSAVFIGAGVISLEFSHVLARAGVHVSILEADERPLSSMENSAVAQLIKASDKLGIKLITSAKVTGIERKQTGFSVQYLCDGENQAIEAEIVVNGAGRIADIDELNLNAAGIEHDHGIKVDEYLRSVSNPHVWVAGDALSNSPQLSPVATYEGQIAGNNLLNGDLQKPDYHPIPSCVFTVPALAQVGYTEVKARDLGLSFETKENDMTSWRSARMHAEDVAYAKVLIDKNSDQILGAHLLGHQAAELIHLFAFAIKHGVTARAMKETVYAYPTFTSDIKFLV
ncbi:dihydrolipoyl dehydrogenase family protein [Permianibacter aggregans]|uniref:Glutathione reductase (NADPH) n=1 Tax=Permianibacter aggregans TaxID=1510150 RepID=A0A4R6UKS4_9GAMM|nr:NAD(P)/FAD-dependent oxidoreductase [Permianibacter aggregans]QGX41643.1 NAD(P)/FAD-dependent oxidoreductase [Permianibacter aggregans]TDQ45715.1 glutathione reductase (NADPH) [Permianibacter aggregans]